MAVTVKKLKKIKRGNSNLEKLAACKELELEMALALQLMHEELSVIHKLQYVNILNGITAKYEQVITGQSKTFDDC